MVDQAFFLRAGESGALVEGTAGNVLTFLSDGRVRGEPPPVVSVLDQVVYVSKAAAAAGDGSIGAPFNTLQAAADALAPSFGGVVLVGPGDYSAESLAYPDDVSINWVSTGPLLETLQGLSFAPAAPLFPGVSLTIGLGGSVQCFQGIVHGGPLQMTGASVVACIGCAGVAVTGPTVLALLGGQLVSSDVGINTVLLRGADIFNAAIAATSFVYLMGCQSWGQAISVAFPVGAPPGSICFYDPTTKGNATNQAPTVTDGVASFMGLPVQSITGVTTQDQVDSLVTALVTLGLATDDR